METTTLDTRKVLRTVPEPDRLAERLDELTKELSLYYYRLTPQERRGIRGEMARIRKEMAQSQPEVKDERN